MKLFSSKRRVVTAAAFILLALFLVRPGVSRLKVRIANSLSRAVGRPVEIGSVHLRFLPLGFELKNLVIYEDPAFGAEPMLRAPQVSAAVRFTSLLRGHLDIARLDLTEPSLNLVRRQDGLWNWASLLQRAAQSPLAPTSKSKSERRPGFPYIEASSGRINFKAGPEKKPYALLNADFSLWQESENTWGTRLVAEPLRTDMNLSDTGQLRMSGTWQRAGNLPETPLQFTVQWDRTQLGQLTKLISGNDKGWRGEVSLLAALSGTPSAMKISADMAVQDFHRYDISTREALQLAAHCDAVYSSAGRMMQNIDCSSPVDGGQITLLGEAGLPATRSIDLALKVENVPASSAVQLLRRAKKDLAPDLVSAGIVRGDFAVHREAASSSAPDFQGSGQITGLRLQSAIARADFAPHSIPFSLSSRPVTAATAKTESDKTSAAFPFGAGLHVEFGPFPVALGRTVPAQAYGWVARSGYNIVLRGEGEVSHTLRLASLLGLPAIKANLEGIAQMDLQIAGTWPGDASKNPSAFSLPEVTGTVQLRKVRSSVSGVRTPIEISYAQLLLTHDGVHLDKLVARAADTDWTGSLVLPRGCGKPDTCLARFNFNTEEIGLANISEWLSSRPVERPWYEILKSNTPKSVSFLENLRASGKVTAAHVLIRDVTANHVSAALELERGKLKLSNLRADLFGGKFRGDWHADFTGSTPVYAGSGTLTTISLQEVAVAMRDPWISGTASGAYQLTASGADSPTFWQSAEGDLQFDLRDSSLPRISLAGDAASLHISHWQGNAHLRSGKIEIDKGRFGSGSEGYEISGSASLARALDLKMTQASYARAAAPPLIYSITGTLSEPRIAVLPAPQTQAELKQQSTR